MEISENDLKCIVLCGITYDYFNEVSVAKVSEEYWEVRYKDAKKGLIRTYTERYTNAPEILAKSNKDLVSKIDSLVVELKTIAKSGNIEKFKEKWKQISSLRT